jgi:hypothetical protein
MVINIPGIEHPCNIYGQTQNSSGAVSESSILSMQEGVYKHYIKHGCRAFILLDTYEKRCKVRYGSPIDLIHGIFYDNWVIKELDYMVVHQFQLAHRDANCHMLSIKFIGGILLGFESDNDAALFKIKYM